MSAKFSKKDNINHKKFYFWGVVLGVAVTLAVMLIFSAVLLFSGIDRSFAAPFATVSVAVGCFVAAFFTSKKIGDKGYIIGLMVGGITFAVITTLSLIFGENGLSVNTLFHFVIIMLSSLAGGIVGVNSKRSKKYI
ncbi:MAG: TIGR04086 family membrane protein [Clostridia bacterium]|nr:TIGR04086 family membrane protein [Clostridia bacterium]